MKPHYNIESKQELTVDPAFRHYARSTTIETDSFRNSMEYYPSPTALNIAKQIATETTRLNGDKAWTITGPYGSGKSSFALFLADIFSNTEPVHKDAKFIRSSCLEGAFPLTPILIQAEREPLEPILSKALRPNCKDKRMPLHRLLVQTAERQDGGLLLIIDEFGKYLEYAARNNSEDLFQLQHLAETVQRSKKPTILICILHSGFTDYLEAHERIRSVEWEKVQGRFRNVPFVQSREEAVHLLAETISHVYVSSQKGMKNGSSTDAILNALIEDLEINSGLRKNLTKSVPLHPLTTLILPFVFQSGICQNERSLFIFLLSHEPCGFQEFLKSRRKTQYFGLNDLYDYLNVNLGLTSSSSIGNTVWPLISHNLTKHISNSELAKKLIKTIGVLNAFETESQVSATLSTITAAFQYEYKITEIQQALDQLQESSVITFRRINESYYLWQGSDFDIEQNFEVAQNNMSRTSLADRVRNLVEPRHFEARAHHLKTGTPRYIEVSFVDCSHHSLHDLEIRVSNGSDGYLFFLLDNQVGDTEKKYIARRISAIQCHDSPTWVAVPDLQSGFDQALNDYECYSWMLKNSSALKQDPIARSEIEIRTNICRANFERIAGEIFGIKGYILDPNQSEWFRNGFKWDVRTKPRDYRDFQAQLSSQFDQIYKYCPPIHNETLNRNKLSPTGVGARQKLIKHILEDSGKVWFNPANYPPEVGFCRVIVDEGKFAKLELDGTRTIEYPCYTNRNRNWKQLWNAIEELLRQSQFAPLPIIDFYALLANAPFGLRNGPIPLLIAIVARIWSDDFAIYEEEIYVPSPGAETFQRMARRPELFHFRCFFPTDDDKALIDNISEILKVGETKSQGIVSIVSTLLSTFGSLPRYSLETENLNTITRSFRYSVLNATDPFELFQIQIWQALGVNRFDHVNAIGLLSESIGELQVAYSQLLGEIEEQVRTIFGSNLRNDDLLQFLIDTVHPLHSVTRDLSPLSTFIHSVSNLGNNKDSDWREVVGRTCREGKPTTEWNDEDLALCKLKMEEFAIDCNRLSVLYSSKLGNLQASLLNIEMLHNSGSLKKLTLQIPEDLHEGAEHLSEALQSWLHDCEEDRRTKLFALIHTATNLTNDLEKN